MPAILLILSFMLMLLTGCKNLLNETAKKDTPDAIFYEAKLLLNERNYDGAIALMQTLGPSYLEQRSVALIYASAYSGRCGLEFVDFVSDLENIGAASNMFVFLMQQYPGVLDANVSDCVFSESIINAIGAYNVRSDDENILMGLSSLTKVGTILSRYADTDANGAVDAAFDHCDLNDFPDQAVRQIGTGIANSILSISEVATDISSDALTEITSICALDPNLNVFCTTTDPNAYSVNEVRVLRAILGSTGQGIGACPGNFALCICP